MAPSEAAPFETGEEPEATRAVLVRKVHHVQAMPYTWPMEPDAESTRAAGVGTCAGKHAVLRDDLSRIGFRSSRLMVVGPLVPAIWPDLLARSGGLREVHECLTVETPWAGPLLVDVTWHPGAIRLGLAGTLTWDGLSDMRCAVEVEACYAVADEEFRSQKEMLRSRLYDADERRLRDDLLREMSDRASRIGQASSAITSRSPTSSSSSDRS